MAQTAASQVGSSQPGVPLSMQQSLTPSGAVNTLLPRADGAVGRQRTGPQLPVVVGSGAATSALHRPGSLST